MNEPLHKLIITKGRFYATVRLLSDGRYVVRTEHSLFGEGVKSTEYDTEVEALQAAYSLAQTSANAIPKLMGAVLKKYGAGIANGLGAERALEMVEKGEVTL